MAGNSLDTALLDQAFSLWDPPSLDKDHSWEAITGSWETLASLINFYQQYFKIKS